MDDFLPSLALHVDAFLNPFTLQNFDHDGWIRNWFRWVIHFVVLSDLACPFTLCILASGPPVWLRDSLFFLISALQVSSAAFLNSSPRLLLLPCMPYRRSVGCGVAVLLLHDNPTRAEDSYIPLYHATFRLAFSS